MNKFRLMCGESLQKIPLRGSLGEKIYSLLVHYHCSCRESRAPSRKNECMPLFVVSEGSESVPQKSRYVRSMSSRVYDLPSDRVQVIQFDFTDDPYFENFVSATQLLESLSSDDAVMFEFDRELWSCVENQVWMSGECLNLYLRRQMSSSILRFHE